MAVPSGHSLRPILRGGGGGVTTPTCISVSLRTPPRGGGRRLGANAAVKSIEAHSPSREEEKRLTKLVCPSASRPVVARDPHANHSANPLFFRVPPEPRAAGPQPSAPSPAPGPLFPVPPSPPQVQDRHDKALKALETSFAENTKKLLSA